MATHDKRVAIVTGSAQGIGEAIARRIAANDVTLVIADVNAEKGQAVADSLGGLFVQTDVSNPEQVQNLVDSTVEKYGRIDILVNDAAIVPFIAWEDLTFEEWRRVLSVNVDGLFLVTKAVTKVMAEAGYGRVVNIASNTFVAGTPNCNHYVTGKGATVGFTRSLASEVGKDGITVNAVAPGLTESEGVKAGPHNDGFGYVVPMQAFDRKGQPEDIAPAVAFLTTEEAGWVTGQLLVVDGGHTRN
ncbi:pyridoxal 4-dehydrogenase, SDR-type [Leucobacter denitrificans]|uniref:SDR family oxidoreductase n=1 Tax=Leucobacter denitrificans TaxID=683042 RepID=A0A7G9S383_9MICO|nr:SDR family NAD(P)-dependent oxidoreductase [Leucobacter denitrificans]QNN62308.1 SDR family oxidoreductase [Leucobacter denitrificans]